MLVRSAMAARSQVALRSLCRRSLSGRPGQRIAAALLMLLALCTSCAQGDMDLQEIRDLHAQGEFRATIEPLRARLAESPTAAELNYLYGLALFRSGEGTLALWSLREAARDPEWRLLASLELARAAVASQDFPAAIEAADVVLEEEPEHLGALRLRGQARVEHKFDAEGGLEDLERVLDADSGDLAARLTYLRGLIATNQIEQAGAVLEALRAEGVEAELSEDDRSLLCVVHASFTLESGKQAEAMGLYDACAEAHPESSQVIDLAVSFFDGIGEVEHGTELLQAFVARVPQATFQSGALAQRLRALGRPDEAEQLLLGETRSEDPGLRLHGWSALTDHYVAQDDLPAAVEAFEASLEIAGPLSPRRALAYADLLTAAGRYERALEVAGGLEDTTLRDLAEARVALAQDRPEDALALYERALLFWPNNPVARYYAARAAERTGDFERAIEHYRQSMRSGPGETDAGIRLARLQLAAGALSDAVVSTRHHMTAHPGDRETLLVLARAGIALGDIPLLRGMLETLAPSRPRTEVVVLLAEHWAASQGIDHAIAGLRQDPTLDLGRPRDAPALDLLTRLLIERGREEEARELVEVALARYPDAPDLLVVGARLRVRTGGRDPEVEGFLERALAAAPEHAEALLELGLLRGRQGDPAGGAELVERAAAAAPEDPSYARRAAQLLVAAGRSRDAEEHLERLLSEHPQSADAALELAGLLRAREADADRIRALATRAARFGRAEQAQQLLETL